MRWHFTLWGRPPSTNNLYRLKMEEVWTQFGYKKVPSVAKTAEIARWQQDAIPVIRSAMPRRWAPQGLILVHYWPFTRKSIDPGNVEKPLSDAIVYATGIDDAIYLPRCAWRTLGVPTDQQRVEVVIEDATEAPDWWPLKHYVDPSPSASPATPSSESAPSPSSTSSRGSRSTRSYFSEQARPRGRGGSSG